MLVFVDVESSGLQEREGHLLEIALVLTDDQLTEVAYTSTPIRPVGVWREQLVAQMDKVVVDMHTKNGLLDEVFRAGVPRRYEAEALLVEWVKGAFASVPDVATEKCANCGKRDGEHRELLDDTMGNKSLACLNGQGSSFRAKLVPALSVTPLAGSTVGFDRRWLREHMPELEKLFSYRSVDVSSVGELAARWAPEVYAARPRSTEQHRALADARGSIELLKYYRDQEFIKPARYLTAEQIASFSILV